VLVVDDDEGFRMLVRDVLLRAGIETEGAASGESALAMLEQSAPPLVILDVNLKGGCSGYEICRVLRERYRHDVSVLFVSGERRESFDRVAGFLIGGDDYLTKPFAPDELIARVRALLRRARGSELPLGLTVREHEILGLLAAGRNQKQVAAELVISPKTVGTHIERIFTKLGVHSRAEAVAMACRLELVGASV
jgi:DNA-binding response OmpR family regulator